MWERSPQPLRESGAPDGGQVAHTARPDLVLVTAENVTILLQRGPGTARLLAVDYERIRSTGYGNWYRLRPAAG